MGSDPTGESPGVSLGVTPGVGVWVSSDSSDAAAGQSVRVYVYAESWGRVEPKEEDGFLKIARNLHDVSHRAQRRRG